MSEQYSYKVRLSFVDGGFLEFVSENSYDAMADGKMCVWQNVLLDHQTLEFYSVPTERIKDIRESYIGEYE